MGATVADNRSEHRYEVSLDGEGVGFTLYRSRPGLIAFVHTEVAERHEGEGLGSTLIGGALDDVRARGLAVLPFCPFVNAYIERHPNYVELVPTQYRAEFGL